jgi:large conductance mechanosensitive channel
MNLNKFNKFLKDNNVYSSAIGIVIGTLISNFVKSFVDNILTPIIETSFRKTGIKLKDKTVNLLGANIKIGALLKSVIEFIIIIYIVYKISIYSEVFI